MKDWPTVVLRIGLGIVFIGVASFILPLFLASIVLPESVGLAIFVFGLLVTLFGFVSRRLQNLGAETWAIGSIVVYIGFIIFSLPIILFILIPSQVNLLLQWIFLLTGITFITLGFLTEQLNLNLKLLKIYQTGSANLKEGVKIFAKRLKSSPLIIFAGLSGALFLSSLFLPTESWIISLFASFNIRITDLNAILIYAGIFLVFLIFALKEVLASLFESGFQLLVVTTRLLGFWLFRAPTLFMTGIKRTPRFLRQIFAVFELSFQYLFVFGIIASITFFVLGFLLSSSLLFNGSIIVLIISIGLFSIQKQELVESRLHRIQQTILVRRLGIKQTTPSHSLCEMCNALLDTKHQKSEKCWNCKHAFSKCIVCWGLLYKTDEKMTCEQCNSSGHHHHLDKWIHLTKKCPICHLKWKSQTI